jgi:hypothetical protein
MGGQWFHLDLDELQYVFPFDDVSRILEETGRESLRVRKLPAVMVVYHIIAVGLMVSVGARESLRRLLHGVRAVGTGVSVASESAITKARQRLGALPIRRLFEEQVRPIATKSTLGAWFKGRRLVALDGSTLNAVDSAENVRAFGRPTGSSSAQIRWVALAEIGTHVLFSTAMAGYRTSEYALAVKLVGELQKGMLCLADRLFYSFPLWRKAASSGADLLWRVQSNIRLPRLKTFSDRSYLSEIRPRSTERKAVRMQSIPVRVIEFDVTIKGKGEHYRLVTTLLDPRQASAMELAQLYASRWKIETIFDELKTHLRGASFVLRSKKPELVRQDFYGLLLAHFGVRSLMHESARQQNIEPDRLSFTHALRVVVSKLPEMVSFSPSAEASLP